MLLKIYLLNKRNDKNIRVKIIKKVYLIDDLKTKKFLEIDLKSRFRGIIIKFVIVNRSIIMLFRS